MARRKKAAAAPLPAGLTPEILDQLVAGVQTSADFQLVWRNLQKAMAERVLKAELTHHWGYSAKCVESVVTSATRWARRDCQIQELENVFGRR